MDGPIERAVVDKKPIPEIDFTLHTMEDSTQVSTQERVCKGTVPEGRNDHLLTLLRRTSPSYAAPDHRSILVAT